MQGCVRKRTPQLLEKNPTVAAAAPKVALTEVKQSGQLEEATKADRGIEISRERCFLKQLLVACNLQTTREGTVTSVTRTYSEGLKRLVVVVGSSW